jgi:hypothetical protein
MGRSAGVVLTAIQYTGNLLGIERVRAGAPIFITKCHIHGPQPLLNRACEAANERTGAKTNNYTGVLRRYDVAALRLQRGGRGIQTK